MSSLPPNPPDPPNGPPELSGSKVPTSPTATKAFSILLKSSPSMKPKLRLSGSMRRKSVASSLPCNQSSVKKSVLTQYFNRSGERVETGKETGKRKLKSIQDRPFVTLQLAELVVMVLLSVTSIASTWFGIKPWPNPSPAASAAHSIKPTSEKVPSTSSAPL